MAIKRVGLLANNRVEVVYQLVTAPIRNANEDNKIT